MQKCVRGFGLGSVHIADDVGVICINCQQTNIIKHPGKRKEMAIRMSMGGAQQRSSGTWQPDGGGGSAISG